VSSPGGSTFEPLVSEVLVGGQFTVADILVTYALEWADMFGLLGEHKGLTACMGRQMARPAFPASSTPDAGDDAPLRPSITGAFAGPLSTRSDPRTRPCAGSSCPLRSRTTPGTTQGCRPR